MSEPRRVVITGIGAITPIGVGVESFFAGLRSRRSAVAPITRFDPTIWRSRIAAQTNDFDPSDHLDRRQTRRLDRYSQFSVAAARLALDDAGIDPEREDRERVGVMFGTALGGVTAAEDEYRQFVEGGPRAVDRSLAVKVFAGAGSCNIAISFGLSGPNHTNGMSCASGTIGIGEGLRAIRRGDADVMLTGGAETPIAPLTFGAFDILRAMSTRNEDPGSASRPFDAGRDGFVMGEGAAVLVLEERGRALARGAKIYAELCGYGLTNDAHHMTAPLPDGRQAARAMSKALEDAGVRPAEIGYVNAHGSSTPLNDPTEVLALKSVFTNGTPIPPVSSTKGYYGHPLGASGAIETAICALAIDRCWLPPSLNLEDPDPACDVTFVRGEGASARPEYLMTNSFGFGGINAVLVLRRPD